jgi:hypothetical protein
MTVMVSINMDSIIRYIVAAELRFPLPPPPAGGQ